MFWLQAFLSFILGACVGSFINAAEYRLARQKKIANDRSRCRTCQATLPWFDLVPLASFFFLRGRCRSCRNSISWQYPLVEAAVGALYVLVFIAHPVVVSPWDAVALFRDLAAVSVAVFLFVYDFKYQLLPDTVTIPAMIVFAAASLLLGMSWASLLIGMAIGAGFFLLQYAISAGAWIGGGDIRYGALLGALFGWPMILMALFLSYVIGSVFAVVLLATKRRKMGDAIAFGTFLSIGLVSTLFWGQHILEWYLGFL